MVRELPGFDKKIFHSEEGAVNNEKIAVETAGRFFYALGMTTARFMIEHKKEYKPSVFGSNAGNARDTIRMLSKAYERYSTGEDSAREFMQSALARFKVYSTFLPSEVKGSQALAREVQEKVMPWFPELTDQGILDLTRLDVLLKQTAETNAENFVREFFEKGKGTTSKGLLAE